MVGKEIITGKHVYFNGGLILDGHAHGGESAFEHSLHFFSMISPSVTVPAPGLVNCRQVIIIGPVPVADQICHSCPISTRRTAEYAQICLIQRRIFIHALFQELQHILVDMLFYVILLLTLVQCRHTGHRRIHKLHKIGVHIPKQPRYPECHIDTGMPQLLHRNSLHTNHL